MLSLFHYLFLEKESILRVQFEYARNRILKAGLPYGSIDFKASISGIITPYTHNKMILLKSIPTFIHPSLLKKPN